MVEAIAYAADAAPDRDPSSAILDTLVAHGLLAPADAARITSAGHRTGAGLRDRLVATGEISERAYLAAASVVFGAPAIVDPSRDPPDPDLLPYVSALDAAETGLLPWRADAAGTIVLAWDADSWLSERTALQRHFGPVRPAFASRQAIELALTRALGRDLSDWAEGSVAAPFSSRRIGELPLADIFLTAFLLLASAAVAWPAATLAALVLWATATLVVMALFRASAAVAELTRPTRPPAFRPALRPPPVSLLVPLYQETRMAHDLVDRLARLSYPPECLDICLVVEACDRQTRDRIADRALPPNARVLTVPPSGLQTKPRALNYALPFATGRIIGVLDAEDWPEPDQIQRVVDRFHAAPEDVACLQGVLDFYNARSNWLSRCFAIDYAAWFRIVLPGLARLGFVIPLGGTTVYFRRAALEAMGGWDAWNVTEDADLGLRLARYGYRTELLATVTREEANCRVWPWIRQRARWLKGYAVTWITHSRRPVRLWQDLGAWKFAGVQILFLGTLSQFVLAPVLWTFWLPLLGVPHPLGDLLPAGLTTAAIAVFVLAELVTITVGALAVRDREHRWLIPWVPTLMAYWPLGTIAALKAALCLVRRPFHWDKTAHGLTAADPVMPTPAPPRRPAEAVPRTP